MESDPGPALRVPYNTCQSGASPQGRVRPTSSNSSQGITQLLVRFRKTGGQLGRRCALLLLVYDELHKLARLYLASERPGHTLQSTALVHEAYLRLVGQAPGGIEEPRTLLRDRRAPDATDPRRPRPRTAGLQKRRRFLVTLDESANIVKNQPPNLLLPSMMLSPASPGWTSNRLASSSSDFLAGLSIEDTARALDISPATVKRSWTAARLWLYRELDGGAHL